MTILSMLVTIRNHQVLAEARKQSGRDTALCDPVTQVRRLHGGGVPSGSDRGEFRNIHGFHIPIRISQKMVRQDKHRPLVFFCKFKCLSSKMKTFLNRPRSKDGPGKLPMACMEDQP